MVPKPPREDAKVTQPLKMMDSIAAPIISQVEQLARSMGATPAQIAMVTADQPPSSSAVTTPAGMTPKQAATLQAQLSKASSPQEAMKIAQAHGLNPQQAAQMVKQVQQQQQQQQGGAIGLTNGNHVVAGPGAQNGGQVNGSGPQRASQSGAQVGAAKGVSPQKAAGNQGPLKSAQKGNQEHVGAPGSTLLALQQKVKTNFNDTYRFHLLSKHLRNIQYIYCTLFT